MVALDIAPLRFDIAGVRRVQASVTALPFASGAFDGVLCSEVLKHVADLEAACSEIARVARRRIVVGLPYRQDTRTGRTTCPHCRRPNPPWGHINRFDEQRLRRLFAPLVPVSTAFVGDSIEATNGISRLMMDWGGNPWGTYEQEEPCIHCGGRIEPAANRGTARRGASVPRLQRS